MNENEKREEHDKNLMAELRAYLKNRYPAKNIKSAKDQRAYDLEIEERAKRLYAITKAYL